MGIMRGRPLLHCNHSYRHSPSYGLHGLGRRDTGLPRKERLWCCGGRPSEDLWRAGLRKRKLMTTRAVKTLPTSKKENNDYMGSENTPCIN